jgi:hypothetical protein
LPEDGQVRPKYAAVDCDFNIILNEAQTVNRVALKTEVNISMQQDAEIQYSVHVVQPFCKDENSFLHIQLQNYISDSLILSVGDKKKEASPLFNPVMLLGKSSMHTVLNRI